MAKVIQVGLGPVGRKIVRYALDRANAGVRFIGAVDPAPDKAGQDLGELCGHERLRVRVKTDLAAALGRRKADVAFLSTVSDLKRIEPQIAEIAAAGLNIVSTCEELSHPWRTAPAAARRIDAVCRKHGVTCLATGVNPGFLMDSLPCALTAVCQSVRKVVVHRLQDAAPRRVPFQKKIGAGLTRAEFRRRVKDGSLRHVGLPESMDMIAARLGWTLTRSTETIRPVVADKAISGGYVPIEAGMVCGVEQVGRAYVGDKEVIRLVFRAAVGEPASRDIVEITGEPDIRSVIEGGVNGDVATCAIVVNAARSVLAAEPGLKTMVEVPLVAFSG
ncbi:MAG: dihydrodipicolinate reductase [Candidatus Brocadiaceae bacterium]|nr:dihydrodipicolinate reductase [Candidatus Brocadiaceae bacterium]